MKRYLLLLLLFFQSTIGLCDVNLLLNSDFSQTNYGWQTSGSFYYSSIFQSCKSCPGYAYFANADGTAVNNSTGVLYQTVVIPSDATTVTFSFSYSIHTSESNTSDNDFLNVSFYEGSNEVWRVISLTNRSATTTPGGPPNYQTVTVTVPSNLIGQVVTVSFQGVNDNSNATVFRIDDVQLIASVGQTGITTGCVTWVNGQLLSGEAVAAAENLCNQHFIGNQINVAQLSGLSIVDASWLTLNALYRGFVPPTLPSDNIPTFFGDINQLPFSARQAIKAMCYLEYGDGRPCLSRDYTFIFPYLQITTGNILRMLCEAWGIAPDMQGYNVFDHNPSSFFNAVYNDDYNYGYFKSAFALGILGSYAFNQGFPDNQNVNPGEFYLVVLSNIINRYGGKFVSPDNYYNPNNIQLTNASVPADITRGVFKTFEQSGFNIPSGGLGLNFTYSYHSDWVDIPLLGVSNYFSKFSNYIDQLAKERICPLGIGWTHTYNIYAQSVLDANGNDKYIVIRWGDGSITVYNPSLNKFESAGVYDKFNVIATDQGHITSFKVISKDQVTTQFTISSNSSPNAPSFFQATLISNQNNQSVNLEYENSNCSGITNCFGSSTQRLHRVIDNFSGRILNFNYVPGSDLLNTVIDNSGRRILFNVNRPMLTLDAVTNARNNTTYYYYGPTDADNHLLTSIKRPNGNTINNTYNDRKLKQIQTPDYVTNVNFTTSYATSNISTQSIVTTTPNSGTQYSITYSQSSTGTVTNITSAGSNIGFRYDDSQNPTLPTEIIDNRSILFQNFRYDNMGNVLQSDYTGGGLTQTNKFTYDATNHMITHVWPNNTVTNYSYDGNGNKTNENTSNYTMDYSYQNGLLSSQTDADHITTNYGYNQYGNLNSISINNTPIHYVALYDEVSRLKTITDANQVQNSYDFDENDNLKDIIQDSNGLKITTSYTYDPNDNVATITPPQGQNTILSYNTNDDLISEVKSGIQRSWNYNQDGTLNTFTDKNQHSFSYTYYPPNDPNEGLLQSNGVQYYYYYTTHHKVSSISSNFAEKGTLNYQYDLLLRPNDIQFSASTYSSEVSYNYDISGNITSINLTNEGKSLGYEYDDLNRLKMIKDWNGKIIIIYNYKNSGLLDNEQLGNGTTIFYHYDGANRLDSIFSFTANKKVIHAVGCSMDNNGNHIRESTYVNWTGKPGTIYPSQANTTFNYDKQLDWLLDANSKKVNNDNNGNINDNNYSGFIGGIYDLHNNLTDCTVDGKTRKFLYDLTESRYGNDSLRYTIDHVNNGNVLAIKKLNNSIPQSLYVYSPYGLVCSIDPQTANTIFYLYDFRGSTIATLDANQTITDYYKYDPWGNVQEASSTPGKATPFLFVGKYGVMYDSPHLYFMRARYYDPTIGRFLGEDSNWNTNLFSYAGNNPTGNIDPTGQFSLTDPVGTGESFVPVWGSYRTAMYDAHQGNYTQAAFNTALAISDLFLVKAAETAVTKMVAKAAIERGEYSVTNTVAKNIVNRPYINSPSTIINVMESSKGIPDATIKGALKYKAFGSFNGSNGVYDLVIDPKTNKIYHFLFKTVK